MAVILLILIGFGLVSLLGQGVRAVGLALAGKPGGATPFGLGLAAIIVMGAATFIASLVASALHLG